MFEEFDPILTDEDFKLFRIIRDYVLAPLLIATLSFVLSVRIGTIAMLLTVATTVVMVGLTRRYWRSQKRISALPPPTDSKTTLEDTSEEILTTRLHWTTYGLPGCVVLASVLSLQMIASMGNMRDKDVIAVITITALALLIFGPPLIVIWFWMRRVRHTRLPKSSVFIALIVAIASVLLLLAFTLYLSTMYAISFEWVRTVSVWAGKRLADGVLFAAESYENTITILILLGVAKFVFNVAQWFLIELRLTDTVLQKIWRIGTTEIWTRQALLENVTSTQKLRFWPTRSVWLLIETSGQEENLSNVPYVPLELHNEFQRAFGRRRS